jgi:excisionase family DNA binding protein
MKSETDSEEAVRFDDLKTTREAAHLLRVSESTVWRWINRGVLPSYRVGPKRVYVRSSDLARIVKPKQIEHKSDLERLSETMHLVPMSQGEHRGDEIEEARKFRAELLAKRGGVPFPPAWVDINEMRDERSRDLE